MKRTAVACVIASALALGAFGVRAAETARFRYVTSVYFDDKGGGLRLPEGVACGANGLVIVGDSGNDRLLRFTVKEKTVSAGAEIKIPELLAPTRVQLTSKGEILALDGKQRRIVRLGSDGVFKGSVAYDGVPAPATIVPKSLAVDAADNLYVLDEFSARVIVLNGQGKFIRAVTFPKEVGFPSDLAVESGSIVVVDSVGRRLLAAAKDAAVFSPVGGDLSSSLLTQPTSVVVSKGVIFVAEGPGSTIASFARDGSFLARQLSLGWEEGALNYPSQFCINDQDEVFVADRDNSRLQLYKLVR